MGKTLLSVLVLYSAEMTLSYADIAHRARPSTHTAHALKYSKDAPSPIAPVRGWPSFFVGTEPLIPLRLDP